VTLSRDAAQSVGT